RHRAPLHDPCLLPAGGLDSFAKARLGPWVLVLALHSTLRSVPALGRPTVDASCALTFQRIETAPPHGHCRRRYARHRGRHQCNRSVLFYWDNVGFSPTSFE